MLAPALAFAPPTPSAFVFGAADVHLWLADLSAAKRWCGEFERVLSPDEHRRAARFHFAADRDRWVLARGILRNLIAGYLDLEPARVAFAVAPSGKPEVESLPAHRPLRFNLAHGQDRALYGFACGRELGVDLERVRPERVSPELLRNCCSPAERRRCDALPEERRREWFYALWTRKEAVLKACGAGLSAPLDRCDVLGTAGRPDAEGRIAAALGAGADWVTMPLRVGAGYAGALALTSEAAAVHCWRWQPGANLTFQSEC